MRSAHEFGGGFLLERFNELDQIARFRCTDRQDVDVVRHNAIGVNEETAGSGMRSKLVDDPARYASIRTESTPTVEAESDEIELAPHIAFGSQANVFAVEFGHGLPIAEPTRCRAEDPGATSTP